MARCTIRAKLTVVRVILLVAGKTILRRRDKINQPARVEVALHTGKTNMAAGQLKRKNIVIEILVEAIHAVMTIKAGRAK
ncbi:MAG TPA: hypothetical protein VFH34_01425 [Anaerolineales bacterium]|nr:hypothetical protein [Anaerolineales bacterium]